MIIPPDPEKDPRLFDDSASASTPSLLPPPTESDVSDQRVNTSFGYPLHQQGIQDANPFADGVDVDGDYGESLPPYRERRRSRDSTRSTLPVSAPEMRERDRSNRPLAHVIIPTLGDAGLGHGMGIAPSPAGGDGDTTPTSANPFPSAISGSSTANLARGLGMNGSTLVGTSTGRPSVGSGPSNKPWQEPISKPRRLFRKLLRPSSAPPAPIIPSSTVGAPSFVSFSSSEKPAPPPSKWQKYRRYIIAALVLLVIGVAALIGLVVGFKTQSNNQEEAAKARQALQQNGPAWHDTDDTDGRLWSGGGDGSMNLTWTPSRDNPPPSDGNLTSCNSFTPLNSSNFSSLYIPYPGNSLYSSTFLIPLKYFNTTSNTTSFLSSTDSLPSVNASAQYNSSVASPTSAELDQMVVNNLIAYGRREEIPIFSRGIASSGTIEFIGADADPGILGGGTEGMIRVDVVVQYGGYQDLSEIMQVCELVRPDGAIGVGVYTPTQTDGKITNPYMLDPTLFPSFHVIVRLPPSVYYGRAPSLLSQNSGPPPPPLRLRSVNIQVDQLALRMGNTEGVVDFGQFGYTAGRGGVLVDYMAARQVNIGTGENAVRGKFNVSESLYVNATDSSIMTEIILHDPGSTVNTSITPSSWMQKRQYAPTSLDASPSSTSSSYSQWTPSSSSASDWAPPPYASPSPSSAASTATNALASAVNNLTISNTINTTIYTTNGLVWVSYISHPPRTALESWIATNQGEMDISYHPNFIGPFAIRNAWGSIRLPPPRNHVYDDPLGLGRSRAVVEGIIAVYNTTQGPPIPVPIQNVTATSNGTYTTRNNTRLMTGTFATNDMFTRAGLDQNRLALSGTTVTGAAYWQAGKNGTMTPMAVQGSVEARGAAVVLGGWGDVVVGSDGR